MAGENLSQIGCKMDKLALLSFRREMEKKCPRDIITFLPDIIQFDIHLEIFSTKSFHWDIERGLVIIPWVLKSSKSWNNDPERVFNINETLMGPFVVHWS